jgi:hypothetical protein
MSQAVAISCALFDLVVVVNDAFRLAPWAHALAAQDFAWWRANPDAKDFAGRKFSSNEISGVERILGNTVGTGSSSGVLALEVARRLMADSDEPKLIQLYGYENHNRNGYHYFGRHGGTLRTTQDNRFKVFEQQLSALGKIMKKEGFGIVNMTPDSDLRCFDRG